MRTSKVIHVVSCHAEGEVGDVIVGGVAPPPGDTLWEQSRFIAKDETLRNLVLNEPRGGVFRHVNLLVPPKHPDAAMGFIIMEPVHTPPMSGSNSMCVSTVLLETGIIAIDEPETRFRLEAPGGLVRVTAECRDGKAVRVTVRNLPSFAGVRGAPLEVEVIGTLAVDLQAPGLITPYGAATELLVELLTQCHILAAALAGGRVMRHAGDIRGDVADTLQPADLVRIGKWEHGGVIAFLGTDILHLLDQHIAVLTGDDREAAVGLAPAVFHMTGGA